jgi:hypothetical protein
MRCIKGGRTITCAFHGRAWWKRVGVTEEAWAGSQPAGDSISALERITERSINKNVYRYVHERWSRRTIQRGEKAGSERK